MADQLDIFAGGSSAPAGLRYAPERIDRAAEADLVRRFAELPFKEFEFHGYQGKRRVVSYGWRYDFAKAAVEAAPPIPAFLLPLRAVAGTLAGLPAEEFVQALVTEYAPGTTIGWHRDKAVFGDVVGISLLSPCTFRLRRARGERRWERFAFTAEPRSAYLLRGPVRTEWEHSIPPVPALRYSVTFRQKRPGGLRAG
jgi:alkylated DNA repair dioxygenase AlkB